ncbi:superoxide dismutase family protein [Pseudonocardia sp. GCM10023141]|uniref:superoxide dismutase family protein n=1 Tax=Pseudonocardia sp. GCM10023141 TaxID=3252653 RepID=UPI00360FC025
MRSPRPAFAGLVAVFALTGCGAATAVAPAAVSVTSHDTQVSATFVDAPGVAVTYDAKLVRPGSRGAVSSTTEGGNTTVKLAVRGLEPSRVYGAHAHTKACGATGDLAGPHFQNKVDPVQPSVDPKYANPQNEIWLDFTTDANGAGSAETTVPWAFPDDRRAHSVVIHAMGTATDAGHAGTAGARAACMTVDF